MVLAQAADESGGAIIFVLVKERRGEGSDFEFIVVESHRNRAREGVCRRGGWWFNDSNYRELT